MRAVSEPRQFRYAPNDQGAGDGRADHIGSTANDSNGTSCSGEDLVSGPLVRKASAVIDDGPLFDSHAREPAAFSAIEPLQQAQRMAGPARVTVVAHIDGRVVRIELNGGLVREFDFTGVLSGMVGPIDDNPVFPRVAVGSM